MKKLLIILLLLTSCSLTTRKDIELGSIVEFNDHNLLCTGKISSIITADNEVSLEEVKCDIGVNGIYHAGNDILINITQITFIR